MKITFTHLLVIILFISCKSNHVATNKSWGGNFQTGNKEIISRQSAAKDKISAKPSSIVEKITLADSIYSGIISRPDKQKRADLFSNVRTVYSAIKKHTDPEPAPQAAANKPMEPNSFYGFWLVIGSIVLRIASSAVLLLVGVSNIQFAALIVALISLASFFAIIAGFVLGIIGLGVHKKNPGKYAGKGKALAAVLIPSIGIALLVLGIILLLAVASGF